MEDTVPEVTVPFVESVALLPRPSSDSLETHQQAFVLLLGHRRYLVHVVASHVLCSFEFDGQKLFGDHIQADAIQSSPPEPFLMRGWLAHGVH